MKIARPDRVSAAEITLPQVRIVHGIVVSHCGWINNSNFSKLLRVLNEQNFNVSL